MKVIVIARTRDEEQRIERFIMSYQWADKILVADGGSLDNTVSIAKSSPKTEVKQFGEKIWSKNGKIWRNPHGKHINFLIKWAEKEGADWIIFDDCDCVPNYALKSEGRFLLKTSMSDCLLVNRVYFYGDNKYFEKLTKPDGYWTPSLWAWKANKGVQARESDWEHHMEFGHLEAQSILPPFCLLHYFYPNEEFMEKKLRFYRSQKSNNALNPKEYGGRLLPLEDWMRE